MTGPSLVATLLDGALLVVVAVLALYSVRHYCFTLARLFAPQRHPYLDVQTADWPSVTVLVPAHNEEKVVAHALDALLAADYPPERLRIIPVNDRSADGTGEILDDFARRYDGRVLPLHRKEGDAPGKAAALRDATALVEDEIILVFDADYVPTRALIKRLVAPFFDPEVGAVMGRVVPLNVKRSLLTRLLDLERAGGYQVDQQARMNLRLVPQYGGTVGGVRRAALAEVGGWRIDTLAEDTDVTFRLLLASWQVVYENRAECYEEVPESWPARVRQITRWARGHNQALVRYWRPMLRARHLPLRQRVDGVMLLGVFAVAPLMLVGWALTVALLLMGQAVATGTAAFLAITTYSMLGNFAAFYEVAAAVRLDGHTGRARLLALLWIGFLVNAVAVSRAVLPQSLRPWRRRLVWHKTERFRTNLSI